MYYMYVQVRDGIDILFIVTKFFFGCRGRDLQCRQVKFTQVKSRVILVQVKSSQESQKLVTGVRLESTINAVIEGIHVHRSVKLFLVLLRGLRGAPQSLSTARTPHARPSLCPRKIPAGTRGAPYPPRSLLAGPRSVLAGVWNYLQPVVYMLILIKYGCIYRHFTESVYRS